MKNSRNTTIPGVRVKYTEKKDTRKLILERLDSAEATLDQITKKIDKLNEKINTK
jgi:hypothetical protein